MVSDLKPYAEMRDSGVEWLEEVPAHWDVRRLAQFGTLSKGSGGNKDDERSTGVPCIRYGDLYTTHHNFILRSRSFISTEKVADYTTTRFGDLLFASSGESIDEIGKSAANLMQEDACCGGDVIIFRPTASVDARYLGYVMDCPPVAAQKARMGRGITVMHIYGAQLKYLKIPFPPLREQTEIARFLDHAERRIRRYIGAKQKLVALLEEQKQAVIDEAVTGRIDVRTGQPYPSCKEWGVKWRAAIPEHWGYRRLKSLVKRIDQGVSPQAENCVADSGSWGVLKAGCVNAGEFRDTEHKRLPSDFVFDPALKIKLGDVLVSRASGSPRFVGSVGRVKVLKYQLILSDKTFRLVFTDEVDPDFMVLAMNGPHYRQQVERAISGADGLANNLPLSSLRTLCFAIPNIDEQRTIVRHVATIWNDSLAGSLRRAKRNVALFEEYRTRLIADVVTGKLDVRGIADGLPANVVGERPCDGEFGSEN